MKLALICENTISEHSFLISFGALSFKIDKFTQIFWLAQTLFPFAAAEIITVIEEDISSIYLRAFLKTRFVWETMVRKVPECCCMWSNLLFQLILHKNSEPSFTSSVVMWTASLPLRNTLVTGVSPIFQKVTKNLNTWWKLNEKKFSKLVSKNS